MFTRCVDLRVLRTSLGETADPALVARGADPTHPTAKALPKLADVPRSQRTREEIYDEPTQFDVPIDDVPMLVEINNNAQTAPFRATYAQLCGILGLRYFVVQSSNFTFTSPLTVDVNETTVLEALTAAGLTPDSDGVCCC